MKISKCDACGVETDELETVRGLYTIYCASKKVELCGECSKKLNDYLEARRNDAVDYTARFLTTMLNN